MENQQLIKKDRSANSYSKIFPWTFTDLVLDRVTKESLDNILVRNNFIALPYVGSKAATRLQVPMKNRRRGIWLSYIDYAGTLTVEYYNDNNLDDNHWQDSSYWLPYNTAEFQPASVGLSALAQEVFDWINSQITAAVKLNPEDLQKNSSGQIEEANRAYDTSTFSGLGYRILRKNIQSNKNILTQSMINMPNNVYKIRYDFDLNGATINLPANSVLQFVGGSIKNGTLNGNNTVIEADSNAVIFDSVVIEGTWNVEHIYDSWFAFNTSPSYISNQIITNILALSNDDVYNTIHFDADRTYYFELPYKGRANLGDDVRPDYWKLFTDDYAFLRIFTGVTSNTHFIFNNTLQMIPTNQGAYSVFYIANKSNIEISGKGSINGDALNHKYTDPFAGTEYYGEFGFIFDFKSCDNIVVKDVTIGYAFGDNILFSNTVQDNNGVKTVGLPTNNVIVNNAKILFARRNGIALGGNNYSISDVYFEGNGSDTIRGTAPKAAIDFENDFLEEPSSISNNITMTSCKFKDNKFDVSSFIYPSIATDITNSVTITNCNFTAPLRLNTITTGMTFNDCHIVGISSHDNSIIPWYNSKNLVFNSCIFDELNPYLSTTAKEQGKTFNNCKFPEDTEYSTIFRVLLNPGKAAKISIPKPIIGEIDFSAIGFNSGASPTYLPINHTIYTFGNTQALTNIKDIKLYTNTGTTSRYGLYRSVPVFSNITYTEDANNYNIYFTLGGELISNPYTTISDFNIFLKSKTRYIVVTAPVTDTPNTQGIYGGKWSEVSAVTISTINVSDIPSTVTFPNKDMFPASLLADMPTSLTSDKVGKSIFLLDNDYKRPAFWDSYSSVWRDAAGFKLFERRASSISALNTLAAKLTTTDVGYPCYMSQYGTQLTWDGTKWLNPDGTDFSQVRIITDSTNLATNVSYNDFIYKIVGNIDLGGGELTIASGSTLDFQGGSFSNGTIVGSNTKIIAGLQKIFDTNVIFSGTWNVTESFVEWAGCYPNNTQSVDFKTAYYVIKPISKIVQLNSGTYYSNAGEISVNSIRGVNDSSITSSIIQFTYDSGYDYGLLFGNYEGGVTDRLEGASLEGIKVIVSSSTIKGHTALMVGACGRCDIKSCNINIYNSKLTLEELTSLYNSKDRELIASSCNKAIAFNGAVELFNVERCSTYGDIGIALISGTDFLTIRDSIFVQHSNGFAGIAALKSSSDLNIVNNSYDLGLYGIYLGAALSTDSYVSFSNCTIEKGRIEQLKTSLVDADNRAAGYSIYIGQQNYLSSLSIRNILLASECGGIYIDSVANAGYVNIQDIKIYSDATPKYVYNFNKKDSSVIFPNLTMRNFSSSNDIKISDGIGVDIIEEFTASRTYSAPFSGNTGVRIYNKNPKFFNTIGNGEFVQKKSIVYNHPNGAGKYFQIPFTDTSTLSLPNYNYVKINIEYYNSVTNTLERAELVRLKDKTISIINATSNIRLESSVTLAGYYILLDSSLDIVQTYNATGVNPLSVKVDTEIVLTSNLDGTALT